MSVLGAPEHRLWAFRRRTGAGPPRAIADQARNPLDS